MAIDDEIRAFDMIRSKLEAEHMHEWVLMRDGRVVDFFPSFERAAAEGLRQFGRSSYLVRQIGAEPIRLPVSVIHHGYAR